MQCSRIRLGAVEIGFERLVVLFHRCFNQPITVVRSLFLQRLRDIHIVKFGAQVFVLPDNCAVVQQIYHAGKTGFHADRQLQHQRHRPKAIHYHVDATIKIRPGPVHLVDKTYTGNVVFIGLTPHGLRLRLYTRH